MRGSETTQERAFGDESGATERSVEQSSSIPARGSASDCVPGPDRAIRDPRSCPCSDKPPKSPRIQIRGPLNKDKETAPKTDGLVSGAPPGEWWSRAHPARTQPKECPTDPSGFLRTREHTIAPMAANAPQTITANPTRKARSASILSRKFSSIGPFLAAERDQPQSIRWPASYKKRRTSNSVPLFLAVWAGVEHSEQGTGWHRHSAPASPIVDVLFHPAATMTTN